MWGFVSGQVFFDGERERYIRTNQLRIPCLHLWMTGTIQNIVPKRWMYQYFFNYVKWLCHLLSKIWSFWSLQHCCIHKFCWAFSGTAQTWWFTRTSYFLILNSTHFICSLSQVVASFRARPACLKYLKIHHAQFYFCHKPTHLLHGKGCQATLPPSEISFSEIFCC